MIKATVLGDCKTGKTTLCLKTFEQCGIQIPLGIDPIQLFYGGRMYGNPKLKHNQKEFTLEMTDTCSPTDYDRIRPLGFPGTTVFLLLFSLESHSSFESIESRWVPEVKRFSKQIPIILVGTKLKNRSIKKEMGHNLQRKLSLYNYVECEALSSEGIINLVSKILSCSADYLKSKEESHCQII